VLHTAAFAAQLSFFLQLAISPVTLLRSFTAA